MTYVSRSRRDPFRPSAPAAAGILGAGPLIATGAGAPAREAVTFGSQGQFTASFPRRSRSTRLHACPF